MAITLQFVPRSGTFGEGAWQETVTPRGEYLINARHHAASSWCGCPAARSGFSGPANGSTQSGSSDPLVGAAQRGRLRHGAGPEFHSGYPIQDIFIDKSPAWRAG
jgi:hypothetical protein